MAINAKDVIHQAVDLLQDTTSIQWPAPELVRWLNAGQRQIIVHRPDALNKAATMTCVAGTKQTLPADAAELIEVVRNNTGISKRVVRSCDRSALDAQIPGWHALTGKDEIRHFMYDPREPKAFWVYPPATASAVLDINYAANPTDIAEPAPGSIWSDVVGTISVADKFANALVDYIMYRASFKEGGTQNLAKASAYAQTFAGALGIDVKSLIGVAPKGSQRGEGAPA
jgi:hypothetical protein